eukprot:4197489-Amphidinium_carterae.2
MQSRGRLILIFIGSMLLALLCPSWSYWVLVELLVCVDPSSVRVSFALEAIPALFFQAAHANGVKLPRSIHSGVSHSGCLTLFACAHMHAALLRTSCLKESMYTSLLTTVLVWKAGRPSVSRAM